MKKILTSVVLAAVLMIGALPEAEASDVFIGISPATGWDCYVMTETVYHPRQTDLVCGRLKMVTQNGNVHYLDYEFDVPEGYFKNSDGFRGKADPVETPIEYKMWQTIRFSY